MRSPLRIVAAVAALAALGAGAPARAAEPTGRQLVLFEQSGKARSSSAVTAVLARAGVRRAGRGAPRLGVATVSGPRTALAKLRRDPSVASVVPEYRRDLRRVPNDPSLGLPETAPRTPAGTPLQWALARQGFPAAWDITTGEGAVVGVIDTGLDGGHPQLGPKVASSAEFGTGSGALNDSDGHGSHVSGLACAQTDDGAGIAGAGWGCKIVVVKAERLRDEDIVNGIIAASDRGAHAINMSFGGGGPSPAFDRAFDYALERNVVLVAAASNDSEQDSGAPASQLQPGDAPNLDAGKGLVVTGADFSDRNAGTGFGGQISLAAYGFFDPRDGPPGLISSYTAPVTPRELPPDLCGCRTSIGGDNRYAYLQGTSMSTPQVTAVAALMRSLNPQLSAREVIRIIKQSARRSGGWTPELGWGILNAGAALDMARRVDRVAPKSKASASKHVKLPRARKASKKINLKWSGSDPKGLVGLLPSGVKSYDLFVRRPGKRSYKRIKTGTAKTKLKFKLTKTGRYRFYTLATDAAGNREAVPGKPDVIVTVKRSR